MFCKYCGNELTDDAVFCSKCGKKMPLNYKNLNSLKESRNFVQSLGVEKYGIPKKAIIIAVSCIIILIVIGIVIGHANSNKSVDSIIENANRQYIEDIDKLVKTGKDENSLLHVAVASRASLEIIQKILESGANVNSVDGTGRTVLTKTSFYLSVYSEDLAKLLLESGAEIDIQDHNKLTPLMWAVKNNNLAVAKLLIEHGADKTIKDNKGLTAFDIALIYNYDKLGNVNYDFLK